MLQALPFLISALTSPADAAVTHFVDEGSGDALEIATSLRSALGPRAALDALVAHYPDDTRLLLTTTTTPRLERLRVLLDRTAAQKDAVTSGLAWHTDLEAAKAEARARHLPILSLRLLGRLDEDLSCANSRFFRTLLYSDRTIQPVLAGYVLHWQAVRPAPRLTIDMGDGRAIETTITGNSAHMILDEGGAVVDVIPGLVSPGAFTEMLASARAMWSEPRANRAARHAIFRTGESRGWARLASMSGARGKPLPVVGGSSKTPLAIDAGPIAMTKSMPEMPVVRSITPIDVREVKADPFFDVAAEQLKGGVIFDDNARALVKRKLADAQSFDAVIERLQLSVAKDTVINRFVLHDAIRSWLADGVTDARVIEARLYDELFLTPRADPWLGLVDAAAFTGVDRGGLR
ncbi:MAG: hypothetical protein Q8O67_25520 [Deltaproteobacteria bacterium]|nr:hypothetical protein [Deltaproteobacteria bacterium]